ncbi:MAG: portal protein, partial [Selenomonadaceae bacterium]
FNMLEYLDQQIENRTGLTKYNQGTDSNSLNKTATGINIITQQANQRLELIARIFAETGMSDLFKFLIKLNQMFIDEETVIRLTNGPMTIAPDDLTGEFDLIVNAGMGSGAKQVNLQNLQMLQGIITQLAQVGMAGPEQFYNCAKRTIEEIGYKNVDDFVVAPDKMQQQAPKEDPVSESMRIDLDNAPWQIKMQYYAKQGFQVSQDMFTEQVTTDVLKTAADAHAKAEATRGNMNVARGQRNPATGANQQRSASPGSPGINQSMVGGPAQGNIPPDGGQIQS